MMTSCSVTRFLFSVKLTMETHPFTDGRRLLRFLENGRPVTTV